MTVLKNLTLAPMKLHHKSKKDAEDLAYHYLDVVGLKDKADVYPTTLSGGQQQRIATIKDSSFLANVAVIELMARTKQILSAANRYNGTNAINVSDVFVLFGMAAAIYFIINFTISMTVRRLQIKKRT